MTCRKYSLPHLMLRGQGGTLHATAGLLIILLIGMVGQTSAVESDEIAGEDPAVDRHRGEGEQQTEGPLGAAHFAATHRGSGLGSERVYGKQMASPEGRPQGTGPGFSRSAAAPHGRSEKCL